MFEIRVPVHSLVDVITNSSSVIYTEATSAAGQLAKEVINEVLERAGSDKTADDLFAISLQPNFAYYDYGDGQPMDLVIVPLDGTPSLISRKIRDMFKTEEHYSG